MSELKVSSSARRRIVLTVLVFFATLMVASSVLVAPVKADGYVYILKWGQ